LTSAWFSVLLSVVAAQLKKHMVKYVVRLNPEEREQLLTLVNTG